MENINMTHEFKHPKYYTELRKSAEKLRNKSDQAISKEPATAGNQRSPGPGLKQEDSSDKQQAAEAQASSYKDSSNK